jgi:predicted  nucleic acid-binding Zn-ribbon protein
MTVTAKLVRVFQVDKQLRGLRSRLTTSEKFLSEQVKQLEALDAKKATLDTQIKQLSASSGDHEGEIKRLDARGEDIKTKMNAAQTNKEYKAFLTELNTIKEQRDKLETAALEWMSKADTLRKQAAEVVAQRAEREKVRGVASDDRDKRAAEIKDRLAELTAERAKLAADVPASVMSTFEMLVSQRGDDAMAPVEEQDRKRHEYTCGACMMNLPVESVNGLVSQGRLTRCVSCGCILYIEEEVAKSIYTPGSKAAKEA